MLVKFCKQEIFNDFSFIGLGPGGLKKATGFKLGTACIPGSSHGGIALAKGFTQLYSDEAYDKQDTVSLLGGSGGEINYLITFNSFVALM